MFTYAPCPLMPLFTYALSKATALTHNNNYLYTEKRQCNVDNRVHEHVSRTNARSPMERAYLRHL